MRACPCIFLLLSACATTPPSGVPLVGKWGGQHIAMNATPVAVSFEFDCAGGRIDNPLSTGPDGRLNAAGIYFPGHGGPERVDEIPRAIPAVYGGSIAGDRLKLSIQLETGERIGPFELRRGAEPQIFRCL